MARSVWLAIVAAIPLISVAAAQAEPPRVATAPAEELGCGRLFGLQPKDQERHRRRRRRLLRQVDATGVVVQVLHHDEDWSDPVPLKLQDVSLVETHPDPDPSPSCTVRLKQAILDCPPGLYALGVDDSIGSFHIVAIGPSFVLGERENRLVYLGVDGRPPPTWSVAWQSRWHRTR